jgi:hypothetical protein
LRKSTTGTGACRSNTLRQILVGFMIREAFSEKALSLQKGKTGESDTG